jgi:hypothetical protein
MDWDQFARETPLRLDDAAAMIARLSGGTRPCHSTVWRWCSKGLPVKGPTAASSGDVAAQPSRRVFLEYRRIGGRVVTTEQAVRRFLEGTQASEGTRPRVLPAQPSVEPPPSGAVSAAKTRIASFVSAPLRPAATHHGDRSGARSPLADPAGRDAGQRVGREARR